MAAANMAAVALSESKGLISACYICPPFPPHSSSSAVRR